MKVLLETKTTAAWNGDLPPKGMPKRLARSGRFCVARVWRPGPKVSSALPSRKKTARWLSSTMSWLPRRIAAVPFARPARHHGLAGRVLVLDDVHEQSPLARSRSAPVLTTSRITGLAAAPAVGERPHPAPPAPSGGLGAPSPAPAGGDSPLERRDLVEQREVELVEPLELRLADLDRVEEAGWRRSRLKRTDCDRPSSWRSSRSKAPSPPILPASACGAGALAARHP